MRIEGGEPCGEPSLPRRPGGIFRPSADATADGTRDLSKLDRLQLLQLLDEAVRENDRLKKELASAKQQLEDRRIALADSESLADAALRLSGIFEDAQRAIDLYRSNATGNVTADAQPVVHSMDCENANADTALSSSATPTESPAGTDN